MRVRHGRWVLLCAIATACASGGGPRDGGARAAEEAPTCADACVVHVENRSHVPLEVMYHEGLSRTSLGVIAAYGTATFTLPPGIDLHSVEARLPAGGSIVGREIGCQRLASGEKGEARLVCDLRTAR